MSRLPPFILRLLLCVGVLLPLGVSTSSFAQPGAPAPEAASERSRLTDRGRIMASGQAGAIWSNDGTSFFGSYPTWTLRADVAVTYFVWRNLGVGLVLNGGWSQGEVYPGGRFKERELGAGLELVPSFTLSGRWSLMLRPFIGYGRAWTDVTRTTLESTAETHYFEALSYVRFALSLPFIYAINDNLGVGAGPDLRVDVLFGQESERRGQSIERDAPGSRMQLGASLGFYASF